MPFNVLVVASEKELKEFVPHVQAAKKYVGPIRVFKEHRSVEACEQAQEAAALGGLHVALLSNHFTAPGKAEFSDALRKVLRDQFHETPIVCWAHPSKGGDKGKHYHHALQEYEELGPMLAKIKNKELVAEWKEKGEKKGLFGRKSIDSSKASPRPSMDQAPKKTPEPARKPPPPAPEPLPDEEPPAPRRRSVERPADTGAPGRRKSMDAHSRASREFQRASMDLFGPNAGFSGMGSMGGGMSGMSGMGGSMVGGGMDRMGSFPGMSGMGASGMGGMGTPGMGGMGMASMPGIGAGGMDGMGAGNMGGVPPPAMDPAAAMGGMNSFINARPPSTMMMHAPTQPYMQPPPQPVQPYMQPPPAPVQPLMQPTLPQTPMHQPRPSAEHVIQQFSSVLQAQNTAAGAPVAAGAATGAPGSTPLAASTSVAPMNGMQAPVGIPQPQFPGASDPSAMMANLSVSDNSNAALIKMLAEEVVSLRKALEAKEALRRATTDPAFAGAQQGSFTGASHPFHM